MLGAKLQTRTHAPLVSQGSLDSSRIPLLLIFGSISTRQFLLHIPTAMRPVQYFPKGGVGGRYKNPDLHRLLPQYLSLFETHSYNPREPSSCRTLVGSTCTFTSRVLTTTLCRLHSHVEQLLAEHRRSSSAELGVQPDRAWTSSDPYHSGETCVTCSSLT
jgi:hypothetical protein